MAVDTSIQSSASRVRAPRRSVGQIARRVVPHVILVVFSAAILLPLLWVLRVAVTDKVTAYQIPPEWVTPRLDNFIEIFTEYPFATYFLTSTVVAIASTLIALPLAAGLGYAFARYNTGGMALRLFVLSSQMLPPVILVLPLFAMFLISNLINTSLALIFAHLTIIIPFLAWILVAFFQGDVAILEQAARVDGATRLQAFIRITLPVAAPGILAAGILAFILIWNEFLFAVVLLSDDSKRTLPLGIQRFLGDHLEDTGMLATGLMIAVIPIIVIYVFFSEKMIQGMTAGAVK